MPTSVFCDESGFTGEFLLDRRQRYFSYASITIEPEEANEIVARIIKDYRVQAKELKGRKLLEYARGRRAILDIVETIGQRAQIVVHHKEFALATKIFEYTYEPLISEINSIFYGIGFHQFIGNLIYLHVFLRNDRARNLSTTFQEAVHGDDLAFRQLTAAHAPNENDPLEQIISFFVYNRDAILKELEQVKGFGGWIVELTSTSLWSLLTYWGDRHESLRAICDESVPLCDQLDFINMMVGRTEKRKIRLGSREHTLFFNLAEPIALVRSVDTPGVQLADVLAATTCAAMENRDDPWHRDVMMHCFALNTISNDCVLPDLEHIDLRRRAGTVNAVVMLELLQRSREGRSLTNGMPDFIRAAYEGYPAFDQSRRFEID
jgi:hypothetical protein